MKIERHWRREIAGWTVTVLALLALQYATVHGYDFGPVAHDTNPTTGPLERLVVTLAPVTILPLGPIARHSVWTGGTRWTGRVMRMLPRFHNYDADCLVFAAVNTVAWVLGTAVFLAAVRRAGHVLESVDFKAWVILTVGGAAVGAAALVGGVGLMLHTPFLRLLLALAVLASCGLVYSILVYWARLALGRPRRCALRFWVAHLFTLFALSSALLFGAVSLGIVSRTVALRSYAPALALFSIAGSAVAGVATRRIWMRWRPRANESAVDARS